MIMVAGSDSLRWVQAPQLHFVVESALVVPAVESAGVNVSPAQEASIIDAFVDCCYCLLSWQRKPHQRE